MALMLLYSYASALPNEVAYELFKTAIVNLCQSQDEPLKRKAGLKILGHICDSDALLDPIKEDVEIYTDVLVNSMQDQS